MNIPSAASLYLRLHSWAAVAPLMGAIFAPFSTLFDIPALTEPWKIHYDSNAVLEPNKANGFPDPTASLVMNAVGLGLNVVANTLLFMRFSATIQWWRLATRLSLVFWTSKTKVIIAVVNLSVYGRKTPGSVHGEGFWCAIISLAISSIIASLLIFHWFFEVRRVKKGAQFTNEKLTLRLTGRNFMIVVTLFVVNVGLLSLLSSEVENWTYFQGIYFSVTTFLLVAFGDFPPTHTVTRVLLFFFSVVGIAQLGHIISMLVTFFGSRADEKHAISRAEFERKRREEEEQKPEWITATLHQEIDFLHELEERQETRIRLWHLGLSFVALLLFWLIGAVFFCYVENWAYGTAMYFVYASLPPVPYVTFLTLGYGDFAPVTSAGRAVFVVYGLIGIPVMASFAVQAVAQIISIFAEREYNRSKASRGLDPGVSRSFSTTAPESEAEEAQEHDGRKHVAYGSEVISHANLTERWYDEWEKHVGNRRAKGFGEGSGREMADKVVCKMDRERKTAESTKNDEANAKDHGVSDQSEDRTDNEKATDFHDGDPYSGKAKKGEDEEAWQQELNAEFDEDAELTERILELAISLELRARKLLIMHLGDDDSAKAARIVLKADQNIQLREVKGTLKDFEQSRDQGTYAGETRSDGIDAKVRGGDAPNRVKNVFERSSLDHARTTRFLQRIFQAEPHNSFFTAAEDQDTFEEIRHYRDDFAGLLAAGSRLMRLKGNERALFERRRFRERSCM
ncbi:voltage-gated potassium channel [Ramaria rubella]|nr:voltage-gated potassium channel [Ramaria rubella]